MAGNREYKSDVFCMLMENKSNALQLYNAVNGSNYTDPELVEIKTLDKGVSLTIRNDMAFVLDVSLSLYEHQSTVCPNMPLRSLIYLTHILQRMLKKRDIYGKSLVKLPIPKFVVFYNGTEAQPEQSEQRLSDAFERPVEDPQLELVCKVYNINQGKNKELLDRCPVLKEYMIFVDCVREFSGRNDCENLQDAIERAIDHCIEENVLREFLIEHRMEVVKVMQLDYTFDRRLELQREEVTEEVTKKVTEEVTEKVTEEVTEQGIKTLLTVLRNLKQSSETARTQLKDEYHLNDPQADHYMNLYWNSRC
jgi:phage antirepressor YoqD-like protein